MQMSKEMLKCNSRIIILGFGFSFIRVTMAYDNKNITILGCNSSFGNQMTNDVVAMMDDYTIMRQY